ncbi:E3 ubiquitin-protein ligase RBBP6 isoform X2 [Aethina tumida]|uniref:E3 ubiquitin-protein ligase RBBP6 isoform X2 n=1 Tax=Aethina tumida TaxID=116153 RepID=UPI00214985ED|nr:E3 ubiquitin-protein ligase RBBP6 isoform X2 [Aethina tumida]
MSVHYKFKSALDYDTVTFDGLHISVKDLKNSIIQQKRIGKSTDFDLQVTNAQTKEEYNDETALIPKNTSLLIARVPVAAQNKNKQWEGYGGDNTPPAKVDDGGPIARTADLACLNAPEDEKIIAMMSQSTQDYDPSNYMKIRGANQMGPVPPNYRCYKCHQTGHWIKDCPLAQGSEPIEIKKSTGIPRSFMVPVDGPQVPGAMMTPNGSYAVPVLDHEAYNKIQAPAPVQEPKMEIPEDLVCSICSDLLSDAVMIPCCGNSFCDECIRSCLLESEDHECPDCHEKDISPGTLIPNRFLRTSVANFKNTTGYIKKPVYKQPQTVEVSQPQVETTRKTPPPAPHEESDVKKNEKTEDEEKTVISEADSTEHSKSDEPSKPEVKEEVHEIAKSSASSDTLPEGPPGVSPKSSPQSQSSSTRVNNLRDKPKSHKRDRDNRSPRRHKSRKMSPNFRESGRTMEERSGTPTVDEPGSAPYSAERMYTAPPGTIPPIIPGLHPMQGPPPNITQYPPNTQAIATFPPTQGPPPNFRLPPPGTAPYMTQTGYPGHPRPLFDGARPSMAGPPPNYNPNYPPGTRPHRDYARGRIRDRTPPGLIDDPLAAFNRMLREKDERERRIKARNNRRNSYSRSRSRSRSYSRSPPPLRRKRSRTPRRRNSRSRSRSFSMSRRHDRNRDRDRDFDHDDHRSYREKDRGRVDRDVRPNRDRYYDSYDDRRVTPRGGANQWRGATSGPPPPHSDAGYYGATSDMQHGGTGPYTNRYPPREYPPHNIPQNIPPVVMPPMHMPPQRRYDDIAPPGVEEPPIPGLEPAPQFDSYKMMSDKKERYSESPPKVERKDDRKVLEKKDDVKHGERRKRHERRSRTPERQVKSSPRKKSKSKDHDSPDKHKKRKRDDSQEKEDREKKKDYCSDDDKSKKSKDKKKKRDRKDSEKKKSKEKKDKHHKKSSKKNKDELKQAAPNKDGSADREEIQGKEHEEKEIIKEPSPEINKISQEHQTPEHVSSPKTDLYDDVLVEEIDKSLMENYAKVHEDSANTEQSEIIKEQTNDHEDGEISNNFEDESEKDILELHSTDLDLKSELDKNEMLAPMPEKSKWEVDEEGSYQSSPKDSSKADSKLDKSGKVTNEVLKRAENAIFAKAINAIRPIEIKKISMDRAKLYSGDIEKGENTKIQLTVPLVAEPKPQPTVRVSVKDRLGVKVDDPDRVVKIGRNRSRTLSPFSRRGDGGRNHERRVEPSRNRRSRSRHADNSRDRQRNKDGRRDHRDNKRDDKKIERSRQTDRKERSKSKSKQQDKRRRSRSKSSSVEDQKHKRKDKKHKKEKSKRHRDDDDDKVEIIEKIEEPKFKLLTEKRKATIDESSFEPDYDLETESDKDDEKMEKRRAEKALKEEAKQESSSSESDSSSSSEEERKKKKHKKHRKKKRKDSSSSSSDSDSDSSEEERQKRKKHKKKQKKKKKSKHK